ncbi:MAG: FHA domain-containing protein [Actinobacteria bacterium]|nr:FHA domain-containing protein [Actinomycetota bacterium]
MSPALLRLLTLCVLALVYLFFMRVVQAVWTEVRPPRAARQPRAPRRKPASRVGRVVILAPEEHAGRVHQIADEVNIGRAAGCEITIDDSYASQIHARIFRRDGGVFVEDLGSTNGSYLNREKVNRPTAVNPGDRLQIGATVFEVSK